MFSAFKNFSHLGYLVLDAVVGGGGSSHLLQEDGASRIILEDGSGFLLLEI
jgi:hypothetical protein